MISNNSLDDIADLLESNPQIKTAFEKLAAENRLILSRFTHELRNPLTLVKSTIQLIQSQHPEVADFKYWNQLQSDIDDTVALLNELSLYNHCNELMMEDVNLSILLQQVVDNMKPLAMTKNIMIDISEDENSNLYQSYSCDKIKIKQVFTNVIKNAIEAAIDGSTVYVQISLTKSSKTNGHYINISITDTGIPITPDQLDSIFEPFVTHKSNGTGLGLAVSQKIATLHKGGLFVSQTDSTVTFTLQLPLDAASNVILPVAL